jgi:Beta-lactamase enzyme family
MESDLNTAIPGDERDTTTPAAMRDDLIRLLTGDVLSPASRRQLEAWLAGSKTGAQMIRAGVRTTWRVGDKTGRGDKRCRGSPSTEQPANFSGHLLRRFDNRCQRADGDGCGSGTRGRGNFPDWRPKNRPRNSLPEFRRCANRPDAFSCRYENFELPDCAACHRGCGSGATGSSCGRAGSLRRDCRFAERVSVPALFALGAIR